jgi:CRP-like cAMP-binding protein
LLTELLDGFGVDRAEDGGRVINLRLTHHDLADMVASTREAVSKCLNRLEQRGVLSVEWGNIVIFDPGGLAGV